MPTLTCLLKKNERKSLGLTRDSRCSSVAGYSMVNAGSYGNVVPPKKSPMAGVHWDLWGRNTWALGAILNQDGGTKHDTGMTLPIWGHSFL